MTSWFDIIPIDGPIKTMEDMYQRYDQKSLLESVDIINKIMDKEIDEILARMDAIKKDIQALLQ